MSPADPELNLSATEEELRGKARAVLAAGRPRLAPGLLSFAGILLSAYGISGSGLPTGVQVCIACATAGLPTLAFEWWFLNRRLEALLILQGFSRHRP